MKPSLIRMSALFFAVGPMVAFADCPLNSKESKFNCTSYELAAPLNITNLIGGPSLTVMDGNVGIGTLLPMATLDVVSNGTTASESQLILRNPNATSNSAATINTYSANEWRGSLYFIKNALGTIFGISTADSAGAPTERLRILEDGKVGIGTATPGSALHVNGTIRAETICDQSGANCKTVSDGWGSGGGGGSGTVTSITAGTGLTGGTITTSGTIAVDVGTTANKIVQLNNSAALPAVSGANLTNVNAASLAGTSVSTSSNTTGQVLSFNGTNWTNKTLGVSDISGLSTNLGSKLDASNMPASCASNQTLTFTSPTGMWACSNIVVTTSVFGSQTEGMVLAAPATGNGVPTFRKLALSDLPSGIGGGTTNWDESSGNVYRSTGKVGIGNNAPTGTLDIKSANSGDIGVIVSGNSANVGDLQQWRSGSNTVLTKITNEGFIDLSGATTPNSFALALKINNEITGGNEVSGGFGNGIFTTNAGRSFLNMVTNDPENSLVSGGVSNENYRRFRMTGGGSITIGNGTNDLDTSLSRNINGGINVGTTNSTGTVLSVTGAASHTGDLFQVRSNGASNGDKFTVLASGNVGIGTASPQSHLDVAGSIRTDEICDRTGNNCKTIASGWNSGGGSENVTSITAGTGLTGGTITTTGTIAVDVGTTANKIVQLDFAGALPAVSGTNLTNINATILKGISISTNNISNGQVLGYNGTSWANKTLGISDVSGLAANLGSKIDATNMPASCDANQTLTFSSPIGMWSCSDIVITPNAFGTQNAASVLIAPSTGSGTPTFRSLTVADLPAGISPWILSGANIYRTTGKVGIGTSSPGRALTVTTAAEISNIYIGNGGETYNGINISNTAIGAGTLRYLAGGTNNTATGYYAASNIRTGANNSAFGFAALGNGEEPISTTAIGYYALYNNSGYYNVGVGENALYNSTTGGSNTAIGSLALEEVTTGQGNTAVGYRNGQGLTTGNNNTLVGGNIVISNPALSGNIILADGNGNQRINVDHTGKVGIGTQSPGSALDVVGTLRVDQICARNGTNCKTLSSGWNNPRGLASDNSELQHLIQENRELKQRLNILERKLENLANKVH